MLVSLDIMSTSASMSSYKCPLCNFAAPTRCLWLSHIRGVHHNDENFTIICGINECVSTYSKCASFVSHVYRQHRDEIIDDRPTNVSSASGHDTFSWLSLYSAVNLSHAGENESDLQHDVDQILGYDQEEQQKKGALFLLNLKEIDASQKQLLNI